MLIFYNKKQEVRIKNRDLDNWAKLFKATTWEDIKMIAKKNEYLTEAANTMYELYADREMRRQMENREDFIRRQKRDQKILKEQADTIKSQTDIIAEKDFTLAEKDSALAQKDSALTEMNSALAQKDSTIEQLRAEIARLFQVLCKR